MSGRWFKRVTGCVASLVLAAGFGVATTQPALALTCPSNVVGDINGDGHADAAIGELGEASMPGAVHILYGTQGGLVANASAMVSSSSAEPKSRYGAGSEGGGAGFRATP